MRHPQKAAGLRWLTSPNWPTDFCGVLGDLANHDCKGNGPTA